ncbi:zinc finger protein 585A [Halyomorpha halys]|uniref:zinc finger protein 585A n=1 Tax=Halyomorpha halys TaxID=286706 RepID=UPI0006D4EF0C
MLQFQDNDQDIPSTENSLFLSQSMLNTVCNDLNINESEGLCLQGNVPPEKELNFGPMPCSCSSLPTTFSDSNWNIGYQFGANQFTPSPYCLFEQQSKKQTECALPSALSDIEPFMGKEIDNKHNDYGIFSGKQGPSNTSSDCRLLSCIQSQQPLNISVYNSSFPTQDSSLLQFSTGNTNTYNLCLDSDCLDRICSPSRNQYSSCMLDQNLDFNTLRAENIGQVNDKLDLSNFMAMNNDEETILNVNESDEDSEIIVEDSDTESEVSIDVGPYIEDKEKDQPKKFVMKCFVCNLSYSEKFDFIQVNSSFPLTFISQTPVMLKLIEIIPTDLQTSVKFENNLICKRCLSLIDMVENLEVRLISSKKTICEYVCRSSKEVSDEDWSLLQGSNDICIDDSIGPLISKEVVQTGAVVENGNTVETFSSKDKNVDDDVIRKTVTGSIDIQPPHENSKDAINNKENTINIIEENNDKVLSEHPIISIYKDNLSSKVNSDSSIKLYPKIQPSVDFKYQCDRCGKFYRREKELAVHLKKHMGEFLEKCTECGKGFMKKSNLEIHLRKHRKHICLNCRASFVSDIELADHSKHCTGKKFTCSQCKLVFSSDLKLESHKEKHKVGTNNCSICNKSFKHPSYLVAHMISHSDKKPFTCEKCGRSYKNQSHLKRHLKTHSGLTCHICQQLFSFPAQLKSHLSMHAEEEECDICKKRFSKKYLLHHKKIHKNTTKRKECPVCKKLVTTSLKVHMAKHSETKEYKCEICSTEFTFKHSLTKHVRLKHNVSSYIFVMDIKQELDCVVETFDTATINTEESLSISNGCKEEEVVIEDEFKLFKDNESDEVEEVKVTPDIAHCSSSDASSSSMLRCYSCSEEFENASSLESHIKEVHINELAMCYGKIFTKTDLLPEEGWGYVEDPVPKKRRSVKRVLQCDQCDYKTERTGSMKSHMVTHSTEKPFHCTLCDYKASRPAVLKKHIMIHHTKEKPYQCVVCEYKTAYPSCLKSHMMTYHTNEKPFKCTMCEYRSVDSGGLKRHIKGRHSNEKAFQCSMCDYSTGYSKCLKIHIMAHHTNEKPHHCTICDYKSTYSQDLKRHMITTHNTEKPHHCTWCDYKTPILSYLKTHIRINHTNDKPYSCTLCDYKTGSSNNLRNHTITHHSNRKPYQCSQCDYKTSQCSNLKVHIRTQHTKEKPHHCSQCEFKTAYSQFLKIHVMAVHSKEKPYHCTVCEYKTAIPSHLKRHANRMHPD